MLHQTLCAVAYNMKSFICIHICVDINKVERSVDSVLDQKCHVCIR